MTSLAIVAVLIGSLFVLTHVALLASPEQSREALRRFPRQRGLGRLLATVAMAWSAVLLWQTPLGFLEAYKMPLLVVATPVALVLITTFVDELLAPRALGGLLLLVANPILDGARWHPSPLRLVLVALAYLGIVVGIVLVVAPFRFRQAAEILLRTDLRCRLYGGAGVALGIGLLALGWLVF